MTAEALSVTTTVPAPTDAVFAVLADPASHAAIDGTGWVCGPLDGERLTRPGQVFRMGMYHPNHPDGRYEIANQVREARSAPRDLVGAGDGGRRGAPQFRRLDLALRPRAGSGRRH
ncbi:hypothetical protein [Pseudonocardia sp. T1-2H]|uniref:hypothetical protein n=1 Tax=Pseudonocardia sp. T1-2H TaxID=3128899 RepID=UPI00310110C1